MQTLKKIFPINILFFIRDFFIVLLLLTNLLAISKGKMGI